MGNISVFGQSLLISAGVIVLLGLCLGILFYFWSLQLFKKIDMQIKQMKQNIDGLEALSQFVYETSYRDIKKIALKDNQNEKITQNIQAKQHVLEEIRLNIENLIQKQTEISKKIEEKTMEDRSRKEDYFSVGTGLNQLLSEEEKAKQQEISKLILKNLQDLLKEKEQVTVQELVYTITDNYSLADIYQALDSMKKKKQIEWSGRNISPQSLLKLSE